MGEKAVQPCPRHSRIYIICVSPWFNLDSVDFIGLHDSHHTTGSTGTGGRGFLAVCTEVRDMVL